MRLTLDLWEKLEAAVAEEKVSVSAYIRKALEEKWYREHRPE